MAVERCERTCNHYGISKIIYLACATLFTAGFIVQCILIHLVVVPYLAEKNFINTTCRYKSADSAHLIQDCENKCSKDTSKFPCLSINVTFAVDGKQKTAYIYDYYRTFASYRIHHCASSPCKTRQQDNEEWVKAFNQSLHHQRTFQCYYNSLNYEDVLLFKLHSHKLMMHCVIWPTTVFVLSIMMILFTWLFAGCSVWTQDKTVIA